ncbi:PadR family transcriptional regulator [uncultured Pseudokineococcus sp.]|uniref:PadR family transcriptional regulator n=1 Tax=uncultured Pseudokineococcus sp. TaxID=1642928 RepID=UPI002602A886|nr:PadR family transcriptional regulator [uncultured Pseudokineococcus sp.]
MTDVDRLAAESTRGALGTWVLAVVAEADAHGYAVAVRLRELGITEVRPGAVYPVLGRLEEEGSVAATWAEGEGGPGRKVYRATPAGRERLTRLLAQWRERTDALLRLDGDHAPRTTAQPPVPAGRTAR